MKKAWHKRIIRDGDQRYHRALQVVVARATHGLECANIQIVAINQDTIKPDSWVSHFHFPGAMWNIYIVSPIPSRPLTRDEALGIAKLYVDGKLKVWIADRVTPDFAVRYLTPDGEE